MPSSSSSHSGGGGWDKELLFEPKQCLCGQRASLRIVESEKPSKGRLYFSCPKQSEKCSFFMWCHPLNRTMHANTSESAKDNGVQTSKHDDDSIELVHPGKGSKKRKGKGNVPSKGKGKKANASSRLEEALNKIADYCEASSSPSVQRFFSPEIPTLDVCFAKLSSMPEFTSDDDKWVEGARLFMDPRRRAFFMACPNDEKRNYWILNEMAKEAASREKKMQWFGPDKTRF